jgi:phage-related protein
MADFTGFYLDGDHSSTYGILRVSDGDRYTEGLIPEFEDFSIELTGGSGDLYGGRRFKPTKFTINIAFDHMTEKQFRGLRQWLGGEKLKEFRFDERPYKAYWVKVAERPELDYVCFMEEADNNFIEKERIYKGEGEIEFIAYDPFGYCIDNTYELSPYGKKPVSGRNWQSLRTYTPFHIKDDNMLEWAKTSGLKTETKGEGITGVTELYNPGDFETDFLLYIDNQSATADIKIILCKDPDFRDTESYKALILKSSGNVNDIYFLNTKNHTLQTRDTSNDITSSPYPPNHRYDLIKEGQWFKIPQGTSYLKIEQNGLKPGLIKYNYKYY